MARTGRIGKGGHGRPRRSAVSVGTGFGAHPRIDLTSAKLAELIARKTANTVEYQAIKQDVDSAINTYVGGAATLTSVLGTESTGTFTVDDGSSFPTTAQMIQIGVEAISVTSRSSNTFTFDARGQHPVPAASFIGVPTHNASHAIGSKVYEFKPANHGGALPATIALLDQMGVAGYEANAIKMCAHAVGWMACSRTFTNGGAVEWDRMRSEYIFTIRGYDWMYDKLGAIEQAAYAELVRELVQDSLDHPFMLSSGATQRQLEVGHCANVQMGGTIWGLLASAATYGTNTSAQAQWDAYKANFIALQIPGMLTGNFAHGIPIEGQEYSDATWQQTLEILKHLGNLDTDYWATFDTWLTDFAKFLFHATPPGASASTTATLASMTAGTTSMSVASAADFQVGDLTYILTDQGNVHESSIVNISGTTFTMSASTTDTISSNANRQLTHVSHMIPWGDVQDSWNQLFGWAHWREGHKYAAYMLLDRLRTRNPTYGGYVKWLIDHAVHQPADTPTRFFKFLSYDSTVTGVDYSAALTTNFATTEPEATGIVINRSAWSPSATYAWFLPAGRLLDHCHSHQNTYGIYRKGVVVSRELVGYGAVGREGPWMGATLHNSVAMNGHSADHGAMGVYDVVTDRPGPSALTRSGLTSTYAYGRGDASLAFTSTRWTTVGYLNNDAQTYVRDFIHVNPDTIVIHDRLAYANATLSPTKWFFQFPNDPTIATARITETVGGQTLAQDIVLPASAALQKISHQSENDALRGYRVEVTSGVSTAAEYGLSVIQLGDSGFSPVAVSLLTTTNANVVQFSQLVVGFVKGASPTLNIVYILTGVLPRNLIIGMAPSTAYHVTRSVNTITIAAATGAGDTTSTAAGILDFSI